MCKHKLHVLGCVAAELLGWRDAFRTGFVAYPIMKAPTEADVFKLCYQAAVPPGEVRAIELICKRVRSPQPFVAQTTRVWAGKFALAAPKIQFASCCFMVAPFSLRKRTSVAELVSILHNLCGDRSCLTG